MASISELAGQSDQASSNSYWNMEKGVDWCEPNYAVIPFIAELWNALSSLPLAFVGVYLLYLVSKKQYSPVMIVPSIGLIGVGLGSCIYHATLLEKTQFLDEASLTLAAVCIMFATVALQPRNSDEQQRNSEDASSPSIHEAREQRPHLRERRPKADGARLLQRLGSTAVKADKEGEGFGLSAASIRKHSLLLLAGWIVFLTVYLMFLTPKYRQYLTTSVTVSSAVMAANATRPLYRRVKSSFLQNYVLVLLAILYVGFVVLWIGDNLLCKRFGHMGLHGFFHIFMSIGAHYHFTLLWYAYLVDARRHAEEAQSSRAGTRKVQEAGQVAQEKLAAQMDTEKGSVSSNCIQLLPVESTAAVYCQAPADTERQEVTQPQLTAAYVLRTAATADFRVGSIALATSSRVPLSCGADARAPRISWYSDGVVRAVLPLVVMGDGITDLEHLV